MIKILRAILEVCKWPYSSSLGHGYEIWKASLKYDFGTTTMEAGYEGENSLETMGASIGTKSKDALNGSFYI